jgi:transposase InsO family protein
MNDDVRKYVTRCIWCQKRKAYTGRAIVPLQKYQLPRAPFSVTHIDLTGKLPTTESGNQYILVVKDKFTKWIELFALRLKTALEVATILVDEIFFRYGPIEILISDRGTEFVNKIMKEVCKLLMIRKINTTAYNPRANGEVEKQNATLKDRLQWYANQKQNDWDEYLSVIAYSYRTMVGVTGYSPAFALYGREIRFPTESWLDHFKKMNPDIDTYVKGLLEALTECWENISIQLVENQSDISSNKPRMPRIFKEFEVGDWVFKKLIPKALFKYYLDKKEYKIIKKLQFRFCGPYKIVEKHSPVLYSILENGIPKRYHAINLKPSAGVHPLALDS